MSLKFNYILTEDVFPSGVGGKLKPKEEKLLKNIHDYVLVRYYSSNNPDTPLPTELVDLKEFYHLYTEIWDFLTLTMLFDNDIATYLFYLFVLNYNKEGVYSNIESVRTLTYDDQKEIFGDRIMLLSDHFNTLPFLIESLPFSHYGLPSYFIHTEDEWYCVGNEREIEDAKRDYVDTHWVDEEDVYYSFGPHFYISYCSVTNTDKRMISSEEASYYESDMDEEEIIERLKYEGGRKNKEIVEEYGELKEKWDELPASKDGSQYELRIDEIIEEGRELVREIIYDDVYDRLENDLEDYLWEMGIISKNKSGYITMNKEQWNNLPSWIYFDWEDFTDSQLNDLELELLSPYENVDSVYLDNGDIYYIIQIDY